MTIIYEFALLGVILYAGKFESAMKTAVRLAEFEDVLRARN